MELTHDFWGLKGLVTSFVPLPPTTYTAQLTGSSWLHSTLATVLRSLRSLDFHFNKGCTFTTGPSWPLWELRPCHAVSSPSFPPCPLQSHSLHGTKTITVWEALELSRCTFQLEMQPWSALEHSFRGLTLRKYF